MATEIARIDVTPGSGEAFEAAVTRALDVFRQVPGCEHVHLLRSHEEANRYWLIAEWTDVAAHEAFRETPAFAEWRALAGPFFTAKPMLEHGLDIGIGF